MNEKIIKMMNRVSGLFYHIDVFLQNQDVFVLKGWLFSKRAKITDLHFLIQDDKGKYYVLKGNYRIRRADVSSAFHTSSAEKSGFYVSAIVENCLSYKVWLLYKRNGLNKKIYVGTIENEDAVTNKEAVITEIQQDELGFDLQRFTAKQNEYTYSFPQEYYSECIDLIIPVYNGYRFFDRLFSTITHTGMKYRMIIIDDKSPDERVFSYLQKYAEGKDNVILLQNEENLGFVKTVNRGLSIASNHVALINTDIELPEEWLERLMLPILKDGSIASTTPYTTCGTICSFPDFLKDNSLFLGLSVDEIDSCFKKIKPPYTAMPTGVGFCMGMNKNVLQEIGDLDAETFGKGYAEENDWCQRAIEAGYRNVQVENLFVFHNHGGSFPSEEKKRLIAEHEKLLLKKHPGYNRDVANFCSIDPNKQLRQFIELNILQKYNRAHTILALDHALGGGASNYLIKQKNENLDKGNHFIIVRFNTINDLFEIEYSFESRTIRAYAAMDTGLMNIISYFNVDEIWINELVSYLNLFDVLRQLTDYSLSNSIPVRMLFHDYYAVCPTINLLNDQNRFCGVPCISDCEKCISRTTMKQTMGFDSMAQWRQEWKAFLRSCSEVVFFSESTKELAERAYGELPNSKIIPHQISYIPKVEKKNKTTESINIGLLGVLSKHKGEEIVKDLLKEIDSRKLDINLKLIGYAEDIRNGRHFYQTGSYTRNSIPSLALMSDIDVFLIPSIWPETFSYTSEEIMKMGFPLMCFDMGAPAERTKKYEKVIIIPEVSAESILDTLMNHPIVSQIKQMPINRSRVLFVVEDVTFSSRYRVDHLREQLILRGIASDCVSQENIGKQNLDNYVSVVVYRSTAVSTIEALKKEAETRNIPVYYDIDDFIFDFNAIRNLEFLNGDEYKNFDQYCYNIRNTMELCDGYITSTFALQREIQRAFPDRPVVINRNVASLEMKALSIAEINPKKTSDIVIGYFSGTKTHNADFESIKDVLIELMKQYADVRLLVGGQLTMPEEFNDFGDRIQKFDFVDWRQLPRLIRRADINLMPLEDSVFHACKSENKWMEAGLVCVPTIASSNEELDRIIEDGKDGFLCHNTEEWKNKLELLIKDRNLRETMACEVHERVLSQYTTENVEDAVLDLLETKQTSHNPL